jgi:hypothetical protein
MWQFLPLILYSLKLQFVPKYGTFRKIKLSHILAKFVTKKKQLLAGELNNCFLHYGTMQS